MDYDDLYDDQGADWPLGTDLYAEVLMYDEQITSTVSRAVIFQKMALSILEDEIKSSDRAELAFAYAHMEPRTQDEDRMQAFIKNAQETFGVSSIDELIEELDDLESQ